MKKNVLFLTVGLLALSGNVFADIETETFSHTTFNQMVPFTDNFTLSSFDPTLGTLTGIMIDLSTTGNANVQILNITGTTQAFTGATVSLPLTVTGPEGITVMTTSTGGPFSGVANPGMNSFAGVSTSSSASLTVPAGSFSGFEAAGPIDLSFVAVSGAGTYSGSAMNPGTLFFGGSGDISGLTSITYTYDTPNVTPEPALLGVVSLCLGGVVLFRRRSLKKS